MAEVKEYEIRNENGDLFCKCRHDSAGNIKMLVKGTSISLQDLQAKALNPTLSQTHRAKRSGRAVAGGS